MKLVISLLRRGNFHQNTNYLPMRQNKAQVFFKFKKVIWIYWHLQSWIFCLFYDISLSNIFHSRMEMNELVYCRLKEKAKWREETRRERVCVRTTFFFFFFFLFDQEGEKNLFSNHSSTRIPCKPYVIDVALLKPYLENPSGRKSSQEKRVS